MEEKIQAGVHSRKGREERISKTSVRIFIKGGFENAKGVAGRWRDAVFSRVCGRALGKRLQDIRLLSERSDPREGAAGGGGTVGFEGGQRGESGPVVKRCSRQRHGCEAGWEKTVCSV